MDRTGFEVKSKRTRLGFDVIQIELKQHRNDIAAGVKSNRNSRAPACQGHHGCEIRILCAFYVSSVQVGRFSAVIGPEAVGCRSAITACNALGAQNST